MTPRMAGISAAEIEMQTGKLAADHIEKAVGKAIRSKPARRQGRCPVSRPSPATVDRPTTGAGALPASDAPFLERTVYLIQ